VGRVTDSIKKKIEKKFGTGVTEKERGRLQVKVGLEKLKEVCRFAKGEGFEHLSAISATDFPAKGKYELSYFFWSSSKKIVLWVKTSIERGKPEVPSLTDIWGANAGAHEREIHELFGIKFEGNEDLSELFLEDWKGPPPFRKDFDWRKYIRKEFYDKKSKRESGYYD
jgi:NADH-quinone oxidoreductase subunit C